jgi:hypothetical protein
LGCLTSPHLGDHLLEDDAARRFDERQVGEGLHNVGDSVASRLANTLGASKAGRHSQSIDPSGATSAPVWQSERKA